MSARRWLATLLGCAMAGCGPPVEVSPSGQEPAASELGLADNDGVVLLSWDLTGSPALAEYELSRTCTGVLVAPNLVLTTLTCVANASGGPMVECLSNGALKPPDCGGDWLSAPIAASNVHVYLGAEPFANVETERGKPVYRPDAYGYQIIGSGSTEACIDNIALVVLDRALPAPALPLRLERAMSLGEPLVTVGYESHGGQPYGAGSPPDVERTTTRDLHVLAVGPDEARDDGGLVILRTFLTEDVVGTAHLAGTPAISVESGAVVGLYTRAPSYAVVKIAPYRSLIDEAFARAHAEPLPEDDPALASPSPRYPSCAVREGAASTHASAALAALAALVALLRRRKGEPC